MSRASFVPVLCRPLAAWPGAVTPASRRRSRSTFRVSAGSTLSELEEELGRHGVRDAYLEVDVHERDVRQDGRLRADASPRSPGVVLYCTHPTQGALRFAADSHDVWHHNVRAILLTLEALRSVERYGAVQDAQQFRGFKALPASTTTLTMGHSAAIEILREHSGMHVPDDSTSETLASAYRSARARTHPDRAGHDRHWHLVEAAARELRIGGAS
jgi:hypothetical protein